MRKALPKLERRAVELRGFDLRLILGRGDDRAEALRKKYNNTLEEIFGADTRQFREYSIDTFDWAPMSISIAGGGTPLFEVHDGYRRAIADALANLQTIREILEERLADQGQEPDARAVRAFGELDIHPVIREASSKLFEDGHHANAVFEGCKALDLHVQSKSGSSQTGTPLMQTVFSPNAPVLKVADLTTSTGKDEQQGMMYLFAGAMLGLRNPRAHSLKTDDPERAIEYIAFLSMLAKVTDGARK